MGFENPGRPWIFVISTERSEWRNPSYGCLDYARHDSAWSMAIKVLLFL